MGLLLVEQQIQFDIKVGAVISNNMEKGLKSKLN